jgi:ketosteroid isomerase-like protein
MTRPLQLFVLAALLVIPFAVACARQSGSANMESEGQALLETDRAWAEAARKGDIPGLTSFWADDAVNYFPGAPPLVGKQAISQLVNRNRSQPGFSLSWEPETAVVARSGELGYTSGSFEPSRDTMCAFGRSRRTAPGSAPWKPQCSAHRRTSSPRVRWTSTRR